jgi:branched-subunit amino acid aminotransferase/4-amino-4-deoxychorismate lyase
MLKAPSEADLVRLRQFLQRLERDAQTSAGDLAVGTNEIEKLKSEIAYLEATRSRAFLFQIAINYGAPRSERRVV